MRFIVMQRPIAAEYLTTKTKALATALFGVVAAAAFPANGQTTGETTGQAAPREAGIWYDDTGKGAVRIEVCGSKLCGRIVWLKEPVNAAGKHLTDKNNPDPAKRTRPICGLQILGQVQRMSDGGYDNGWVYDPKVGKAYDVALTLVAPNKLKVTGYAGVRFLGKSFTWTRAPDDLPDCATTSDDQAGAGSGQQPRTPAKKAASGETLPWNKK